MSQSKFNIPLDKPLYRTSIMRLIIIDKSEYYLSYSHDDIVIKIEKESKKRAQSSKPCSHPYTNINQFLKYFSEKKYGLFPTGRQAPEITERHFSDIFAKRDQRV